MAQQRILASNPANANVTLNDYCNTTMLTPLQAYGAHVSALGLKFYNGEPVLISVAAAIFGPCLVQRSCLSFS